MVLRGRRGVSTIVLIAAALGLVLLVVMGVLLWPRQETPLALKLATQGAAVAGSDLALQVAVISEKARDVTIVAELFNSQRQLVNIARETIQATKGEQTIVVKLRLPQSLPAGSYKAVVTARYDKTQLVTSDIGVRVSAAVKPMINQSAPVVKPPVTPTIPTPVTQPGQNATKGQNDTAQNATSQPPAAQPEQPRQPVQPQASQPAPAGVDIDNIATVAKQDKNKALAYCDSLVGDDRTQCTSKIAVALDDESVCARLSTQFDQDKCYLSLASAGKASACALIQDEALKATCDAVTSFYAQPAEPAPVTTPSAQPFNQTQVNQTSTELNNSTDEEIVVEETA